MYTNTSKQILSPLAEAVFQLILTISDAEINNDPIPDLTQLARMVEDQTMNLVAVGTRIQNQASSDEALKKDMPIACGEVTKASTLLINATKELSTNARSKKGSQLLLESVKGILSGTTAVLKAFDDFEVRKIVNVCHGCSQKVTVIQSETALPPQQLVNTLMQVSQSVVQLAQMTNKRIGELLQPILQSRLRIAVGDLTKESPLLITSSKAYLQNSKNVSAKDARNQSCARLQEACKEIEIVIQIQTEEELTIEQKGIEGLKIVGRKYDTLQTKLSSGLRAKDTTAYAALTDYISAYNGFYNIGKDVIVQISNPREKERLQKLISDLETSQPLILHAANDIMQNPQSEEAHEKLNIILVESRSKMEMFRIELTQGASSLSLTAELIAEKQLKIIQGIKNRDIMTVHTYILEYNNIAKTNAQLARSVIDLVLDPVEKENLLSAIDALGANHEEFLQQAQEALKSPGDTQKEFLLLELIEKSQETTRNVRHTIDQIVDSLSIAKEFAESHQSKLLANLKQSDNINSSSLGDYLSSCEKYIHLIRDQLESIQDISEKNRIEAAITASEKALISVKGEARNLLAKPRDEDVQREFFKALIEHKRIATLLNTQFRQKHDSLKAISKQAEDQQYLLITNLKEKNAAVAMPILETYLSCSKISQSLANDLIGRVADPKERQRLLNILNDVEGFQKNISKLAVETIMNPEDQATFKKLGKLLNDSKFKFVALRNGLSQGIDAIDAQIKQVDSYRLTVTSGLKSKDAVAATSGLNDYISTSDKFMERVRSLLNELPISADTDYMRNLAVETEESLATVAKLTKRAISNPHDEDNQRRLLSAFIEHKAKIALIQSEMSQNAPEIKKLTEYMKTSEMERASFVSSLKAKNVAAARTSYNQYISANKAYLDAYKRIPDKRQIILDSNSPDATEATHSKFSEAEELQQSIATQAMRIFQNPTDEEAQTTLLDLIAASRERISSIQLSVSKTPRQLKYLSTLVDAQQVKILDGVQIDVDAYDSAITQYLDSAVKFTTIAKGLIEKAKYSKDGDRLKPLLIEFEDSLNCIKEKSQQAIRNPSNRDLQNELTIMLDENKQLMSTLQNELNAKLEPYENHVRAIEEFSMHLLQSVKSGDTAYIIDALNANETEQDTLTHITEGILSKIEDNGQSVKIRKALADISERTGSIQQLIQELSQEPENQKKQKQFSKLVDAQIKQWSQLQSTIRRALVGEIATTAASLSDHNRVESILGYQFDVANKGKLGDAELANSDFHHAFNRISDLTNIAISMVSSMTPQVASDLELQKARLEKLGPSVITAAQGLAANPKDEGVKEFARGILTAWEDSMKEIVNLTIGQEGLFKATEILSGTQSMLDTQFSSFQKSYQMEDALACQKNAMALVASTTQFLMTARREIENTTDSVFRGSLEIKVAAIEKILPLVAIKAKKLSEIPVESDEFEVDINSLQSTVKDIVTRLTDLGSTIKESRSVEEEIEEKIIESYASRHSIRPGGVNANRMSRQLRSFPVAGTNNSEEDSSDIDKSELMRQFTAAAQENYLTSSVSPISRQVAASISQAAALVEEEENDQKLQMSSSNDALVPDILDSYNSSSDDQRQEQRQDDSEVVFPSTSAKQTDAVASPNTLAQKLAKASLQQHNDGGQNEDEEAIDENAEYVEEDAPQLLTAEEAAENPLLAVAQELLVETSSWSSEGNPIVAAAMGLSNQMEKLSKYHIELRFSSAAETKKGFINAAKDIVMHASNIDIPAKQLAEQCTDLRLKRQLLQSIDRIGTIAQQLKIVAAVKAASPKDTDRDQQLIQCAQNLMQAVRTVLRYCEVASIRINKMMQAAIIAQHQVRVGAENSLLKVNTVTSRVSTDSSPRLSVISFRKKIFKGRSRSGTATSSIDDFSLGSASSSAQSTVRRGRSDSNPLQSPSLSRLRSRANTVDQQRFLQQQQKQEEPDMVQFDLGVSAGAAGVSFTVVLATPLEKPDNAVLPTVAPPARRSNTATTTTSHDAAVVEEETRDEVKEPKKSTSAPRQNSIASTSTRTSTSAQSNSYNTVISARTSVAAALPTNIPSSPTVSERKTLLSAHSNQPRTTSQDTSVDSTTTTAAAAVISGSSVVSNSFNFFKQLDAKSKASSAQSTAAAPPPPPGAQSNSK